MSRIVLRFVLAALAGQKTLSNHQTVLLGACCVVAWASIQAGIIFFAVQSYLT
jgi:hypothetical protein